MNAEKRYIVAQAGITLHDLHTELGKHNLAMLNVGSISDQTLAGIVTTATHGSGIEFGVMSTHVMALTLLLADGSRVTCSRSEQPDLFTASLCGLGSTGLILHIYLEVEPAYRLKELQETLPFEEVMENLDKLVYSAEHVRFWWFPTTDTVRCSYSDRTQEVVFVLLDHTAVNADRTYFNSQKIPPVVGGGIPSWDTISHSCSYSYLGTSYSSTRGLGNTTAG